MIFIVVEETKHGLEEKEVMLCKVIRYAVGFANVGVTYRIGKVR
jgi:hypothetical protein